MATEPHMASFYPEGAWTAEMEVVDGWRSERREEKRHAEKKQKAIANRTSAMT